MEGLNVGKTRGYECVGFCKQNNDDSIIFIIGNVLVWTYL